MENNPIPIINWQAFFSGLHEVSEDTLDDMYKRSYCQGVMTATAFQGFLAGFSDGISGNIPVTTDDTDIVSDSPPIPTTKTNINDCRACWCDTCKNIENCTVAIIKKNVKNGEISTPCKDCTNGMRFRPVEKEPNCGYDKTVGYNNG